MILLDTNVISELMRPEPHKGVIAWLDEQFSDELYLPAIVKAEIETGIAILDDGKRKQNLLQAANLIFKLLTIVGCLLTNTPPGYQLKTGQFYG
jgi:predicted nucleic acid-binding protein